MWCSGGVDAEEDLQAAQFFTPFAQNALNPVIPVGQPVGQIHVGQVELRLWQRVGALRGHRQRAFWERWQDSYCEATS